MFDEHGVIELTLSIAILFKHIGKFPNQAQGDFFRP